MPSIHPNLVTSIANIDSILPASRQNGAYTPQEVALIRAYYLLCHAEFEYFLEKCLESKLNAVLANFFTSQTPHIILYSLTFHFIKTDDTIEKLKNKKNLRDLINYMRSKYQREVIGRNNGLKSINLEKMLIPLGILPDSIMSSTLIAELETLGVRRGEFAHNSLLVHTLEDPSIAKARTGIIVRDLGSFESALDSY